MKNIYEHLLEKANTMKIIDTHEHLHPYKHYLGDSPDILCDYFSHYITADLRAAGMPESDIDKICNYKTDIKERFKILEPYLEYVKNTSYYRSLVIATSKLYNIADITRDTIEELNEKFKALNKKDNYIHYIMKELCNIETSINDCWNGDLKSVTTEVFTPVWHPDSYIEIDAELKLGCDTLGEYCEKYKNHFVKQLNDGMRSLKCALAYWRTLYFEDTDYKTANELFIKCDPKSEEGVPKKLQDYMMHYVLKVADENNFVIQIHTGLQEGMGHNLEDSNPMLLKNLFGKYPNLTFDLFHIGYPYNREIITLAKYYPNVYIDMCWAHIISPYASREFLNEALDVLPYNKIFGFGGDYVFYDGVVGHLTMAKQNICEVLADKVKRKDIDIELAEKILSAVLYDNAKRAFKLTNNV